LGDKFVDSHKRYCWVVFDSFDLLALWQQLAEGTFEPSRVVPLAITSGFAPVQHRLNPLSNPSGCFRFRLPYGLQDSIYQLGSDELNRHTSNQWACVGRQRVLPLLSVLDVFPLGRLRGHALKYRLIKGELLGPLRYRVRTLLIPVINRVDPVQDLKA
jgi:hypothetical protein